MKRYYPTEAQVADLMHMLSDDQETADQKERIGVLAGAVQDAGDKILQLTPACDEQKKALHYLDLAWLMASSAIRRREQ